MPIFTDNSTFPIYKFNAYNNLKLDSYESIEKLIYVPKRNNFRKDFIDGVNSNEKQHLFEYLIGRILRLIFSEKIEKFTNQEITATSVYDMREFISLINYRINLNEIEQEIYKYAGNKDVQINKEKLISEIIIFSYKYYFVRFASQIYCYSINNLKVTMDFGKAHKKFLKYSEDLENEKYTELDIIRKKNYITNYFKSFRSQDIEVIEKTIQEILLYSKPNHSVKLINSIIENNITFNSELTQNRKNKILLPFYKLITCAFFYRENLDLEIKDPDLKEKFKKLRSRFKSKL